MSQGQIILGRHPKCICNPVEECKQRRDVNRLRNLLSCPAVRAQLLDIFCGRAIRRVRDQLDILQQGTLGVGQTGLINLTMQNRSYTFIACSLNTQEVGVTVQSIRTAIQI